MRSKTPDLEYLGFPENPIEFLQRVIQRFRSPTNERRKLVAVQMVLRDPDFAVHRPAWERFLERASLPSSLASCTPPEPRGWPIPVFLERAGCGGVAHVQYEMGGLEVKGHRLDLSASMEAFLERCRESGEMAFPDDSRFPFAARLKPGIRLDGRSWELPCLIGYLAMHSGKGVEPVFATGGIEPDGSFVCAGYLEEKIEGWLREVGPVGVALVTRQQEQKIRGFADQFRQILVVDDLSDILRYVRDRGWLEPHQDLWRKLRLERMLRQSDFWYRQGRPKLALFTLEAVGRNKEGLSPRQKCLFLGWMHYLLSCFGRFPEGLSYLDEMRALLDETPQLLDADERAAQVAKAAVQLYDAHRFEDAEGILRPLVEVETPESGLSPIARAKLLGTLGQVLMALDRHEEGASLLKECVEIFELIDPLEVSRAYHYLIHNRIRAGDLDGAQEALADSREWVEETDFYGKLFRDFYYVELARRRGLNALRPRKPQGYAGLIHPYAFALQAWARNPVHDLSERLKAIEEAAEALERVPSNGGILEFLACTYRVYEAVLRGGKRSFQRARENWERWIEEHGKEAFRHRYGYLPTQVASAWEVVEDIMARVPYH